MSFIFTLSGINSILKATFNPPIFLDENSKYVLGFTNFESFNVIPNVTEKNNKFYFGTRNVISIPTGAYDLSDLEAFINLEIKKNLGESIFFSLKPNNNTLKSHIKSTIDIDFRPNDCIGPLLGFSRRKLEANRSHESDSFINILPFNAICIYCNIASGSFINGEPSHIIHNFFPTVPVSYKIVESPDSIIYLPINCSVIKEIVIKIVNEKGELLSFRGETVTVGLHLKKLN